MELIALLVIILVAAAVAAVFSGDPLGWARREWRLMLAPDFAAPPSIASTMQDPRCQRVIDRLASARIAMKHRGTRLLLEDRPGWRRVVEMGATPDPMKVSRIRRGR